MIEQDLPVEDRNRGRKCRPIDHMFLMTMPFKFSLKGIVMLSLGFVHDDPQVFKLLFIDPAWCVDHRITACIVLWEGDEFADIRAMAEQ